MPRSTGDNWMGAPEAASYLGVGLRVVYKLIDQGHIPAYKLGRVIRMRREDVDGFLEKNLIQPGSIGHLWSGYRADKRQSPQRRRRSGGDRSPDADRDPGDA